VSRSHIAASRSLAPSERYYAADALTEQSGDDVGLREFRLAGVKDQWLSTPELVPEHAREPCVPPLGQSRREARGSFFARVVIHGEVFGIEHLEVEVDVLDLIAAELLRAGVATAGPYEKSQKRHGCEQREAPDSGHG
jgi:hypothetical protein